MGDGVAGFGIKYCFYAGQNIADFAGSELLVETYGLETLQRVLVDLGLIATRVAPDGTVAVPDAPGLGIELDEDALEDKIDHDWRNREAYDADDGALFINDGTGVFSEGSAAAPAPITIDSSFRYCFTNATTPHYYWDLTVTAAGHDAYQAAGITVTAGQQTTSDATLVIQYRLQVRNLFMATVHPPFGAD